MRISIKELLQGPEFSIAGKKFLPTKHYVLDFINWVKKYTTDIEVEVITSDYNINNTTAFTRVTIIAHIGDYQVYYIYYLDIKSPICKCFCIYKDSVTVGNIQYANIYYNSNCFKHKMNFFSNEISKPIDASIIKNLRATVNFNTLVDRAGKLMIHLLEESRKCNSNIIKVSSDSIIRLGNAVFLDRDSNYYIGKDNKVSIKKLIEIYNHFTGHRDTINKGEKLDIMYKTLTMLLE